MIYAETKKCKFPNKYKNKKVMYYYRCYYTDISGKRKQKYSKLYPTHKEATEAEFDFISKKKEKHLNNSISIKELKIYYLKHQKQVLKITSYETLKRLLKFLEPIENVKIEDITINVFQYWKDIINKNNFSTAYKNNIYKRFRSLLNFGSTMYNLDVRVMNKFTNFTNPNEIKKEMNTYSEEEFKQFISNEIDIKWKCFFSVLFYCGLRQGEILALTWNDYNNNAFNITKSVANRISKEEKKKNDIKYLIIPPKNKSSVRNVPIPYWLCNDLNQLYIEQKQYSNFNDTWFIFGNIFPLATTTIQKRRDKLAESANIKKIRIHDFRHSCATHYLSNGAPPTSVAKLLGHSKITTTMNIYSHIYKDELTNLVNNKKNINNETQELLLNHIDLLRKEIQELKGNK